ncbi:canalicular multispecific organic anion transporter 2 [Fusarium sporotrichioides]|uniref:Canalicular multispecific organic anion transporter 2 n=1 Tax=Fusarium sporotrichioides TaxID=5514 RepID=A0A395SLP5_FUSSP|nr:canalicular multispecific organic anion transporter 2 [Fusarium sporotrichioides]
MGDYNSTSCGDDLFGPSVWTEGCRGGFDFTLSFQESILSIAPSAVFLALVGPRAYYLFKTPDKAKRHATYTPKLITSATYAVLQVVLLALVPSAKKLNTRFSLAAAILNLLAALSIVLLAHTEHVKSVRPSFLLTAYLFVTLLFDAARLRTEWLVSLNISYAATLSASAVFKLALLVLETVEKRKILISSDKPISKESTSGPFSRGFFVWLNSLLISGWATVLTNNDLPSIYEKLSSEKLAVRFGKAWKKASSSSKKPSLFKTTISVLRWELLGILPPRIGMIALSISQPFLVSNALRFLAMPSSESTANLGYGLIGAFAFVFIGSAILTAWYEHLTFRAGAMVRGGLITMIYSKMMRLPIDNLAESSAVTLMGNDVETLIEKLHFLLVESWANTLTVAIAMYMLAAQLGAVCVAPIVTGIICLFLTGSIGKMMVSRQIRYQKATQDRINLTNEVLSSMKPVKMLGLSERFQSLISQKRDDEISTGKHYRLINVYLNMITNCNIGMTEAITFGAYAIAAKLGNGEPFTAAQAITALSILGVMMDPLSQLLGSIPGSFSVFGCFTRMEDFLKLEERVDRRQIQGRYKESSSSSQENLRPLQETLQSTALKDIQVGADGSRILIADGNFNWGEKAVLQDINTSFPSHKDGSLTMLVGPVGSGKSSLLKAILGETTSSKGNVSLNASEVAFCDQTPWVMNATIRANIIAESKGYDSSWFDTVISACDLTVDLGRLPEGGLTQVGEQGVKLSGGQKQRIAIARAVYSRKPIAIFDDVFSGLDKVTEQIIFTQVFGKDGLLRKNGTTIILGTHAVNRLPESDFVVVLDKGGKLIEQGTYSDLRSGHGYIHSLGISNHDERDGQTQAETQNESEKGKTDTKVQTPDEKPTEVPSDRSVFMYYFNSNGLHNMILQVLLIASAGVLTAFRYVWVTWWGDGKGRDSTDVGYWLSIYTVMALVEGLLISAAIAMFLLVCAPISGKVLHSRLLKAAISAPLSFLNNSEAGSLINRFSQDLRHVDIILPVACSIFLFEVAACFGAAGLAMAAVSWFAISIPFVVAVLVLIQRFYVRTSKQLRLLEIEHKAPLFSHFLETINGLATIRAFGWTQPYTDNVLTRIDDAQKPSYLLNCIQRWLTLVLDMVVAFLTIILVVFAVTLREKINPSLLGIALVNMMRLGTNMKGIVLNWSILETSLGAIARIRMFCASAPSEEKPGENSNPGDCWPTYGGLEVKNVDVQYQHTTEPVLRGLSFSLKPGEKLGICGRSGSGKSSFVQALLRMAEVVNGQINLDGEDISAIPRHLIRQRLSCLTQDPFVFGDSIRANLDPCNVSSDDEIRNALERVGILSVILAKIDNDKNFLGEKMDENFLSHGQRQLFCLARALLKKSSLLILDEPTSSVDTQTDARMQEVIRTEFSNCTIIMIAHRIDTLLDFDKVAVLDRGSLVEFGAPQELLVDAAGAFTKLYRANKGRKTED